ncbi:hypothetical protein AB0D32_06625 [Micromonospora sp. NPDC048170]|uniref:hypothetical protein n=1 Tax=Micromonospora sp. NPDC048170 TaxID=3154819 RepID=UPI0033D5484A
MRKRPVSRADDGSAVSHQPRVVVLTRGHGYGHAARDLQIVETIRRTRPDVQLDLASSGTGLRYYRSRNVSCSDLDIPDERDTSEAAGRAVHRYLTTLPRPDLVVTDEVMWALPVCRRLLDVPAVLITDWFYGELGLPHLDRTLNEATAIVVPDFAAAHPGTAEITVPLHFTGPLVRRFDVDRATARAELGLPADAFVAVVALGGMTDRPDTRAMLAATLGAWQRHAGADDHLLVLADELPDLAAPRPANLRWAGLTARPEIPFSAADVVVADGAGFTVCELVRNGVPALAMRCPPVSDSTRLRLDLLESHRLLLTGEPDLSVDEMWTALRRAAGLVGDLRSGAEQFTWATVEAITETVLGHLRPPVEAVATAVPVTGAS